MSRLISELSILLHHVSLGAPVTVGLQLFMSVLMAFAAPLCSAPRAQEVTGPLPRLGKEPRANKFPARMKGCRGMQQPSTET